MKIDRRCLYCKKKFSVWPSKVQEGKGKFCSKTCWYSSKKGKTIKCLEKIRRKGVCLNSGRTHFKKGFTPWNKGKKGVYSEEYIQKLSKSHVGKTAWNKGRRDLYTVEMRKRISDGHKGQIPWNKQKPILKKCLVCRKEFTDNPARMKREETKYCSWECYFPIYFKRVASQIIDLPTKIEKKVIRVIQKHNLPYKYVGDGNFWIGRKNPDFVNINGEKKLIEVGCEYFKKRDYGTIEKYIKERQKHFAQYGWETKFLIKDNPTEQDILNCFE